MSRHSRVSSSAGDENETVDGDVLDDEEDEDESGSPSSSSDSVGIVYPTKMADPRKKSTASGVHAEELRTSGNTEDYASLLLPKENLHRPLNDLGLCKVDMFSAVEIATTLEELSDKLDIISNSIDTPPIDIRQRKSIISDMNLHRPLLHIPPVTDSRSDYFARERWLLTQHYRGVIPRRLRQMADKKDALSVRKDPTFLLRMHGIKKFTSKGKVQADRTEVQIIVDIAVAELVQSNTFQRFVDAVDQEKFALEQMNEMIQDSVARIQRIEQLKQDTKQVRRDKVAALTSMDQNIYLLHDATQEMIRRKELEANYIRKSGAMWTNRMQKFCAKNEKSVAVELSDMKLSCQEEDRCHESMTEVLTAKLDETESRMDHWMEKYDTEKEILQNELDTVKANRERDLKRMAWLKLMIADYLQICKDDRRIKDKLAEEERMFRLKRKLSTRIQAWWRGEMVRKQLGPYRPPDKKKAKK